MDAFPTLLPLPPLRFGSLISPGIDNPSFTSYHIVGKSKFGVI